MATTLEQQFIPYFLENNLSWRTTINLFLVNNWNTAYFLYCFAVVMECFFVIGFFTKKWDYILGILLILFHFSNWVLMDIAPIGHLSVVFFFYVKSYCQLEFY